MSTDRTSTSSGTRDERELTFHLDGERVLRIRIQIAANTPVVVPVPPRPRQPGDTLLNVALDGECVVGIFLGVERLMGNTPVVGPPRPGGAQG
ncbi:hypothetical protein [Vulcaniibacterium gelatinicum]|uniref:hypothetical protein n=1 Tax=Vulcaniibacterium gelatinicum TaxID=2598725 RepID=UPI0011C8D4DA|nr:hypothetical protein [Vulcaniibacterium gelatinicum]